jgi:hypothetical protein
MLLKRRSSTSPAVISEAPAAFAGGTTSESDDIKTFKINVIIVWAIHGFSRNKSPAAGGGGKRLAGADYGLEAFFALKNQPQRFSKRLKRGRGLLALNAN